MNRLFYKKHLKPYARELRANLTDAEMILWSRIRCKQLLNVQFYRQKAIGAFIVDFFAPKALLIIELDGSQHFKQIQQKHDVIRDEYLKKLNLNILRFDNHQIMYSLEAVLEKIYKTILERMEGKSPLPPL
jgi:very-short-patch-repair endonuclease